MGAHAGCVCTQCRHPRCAQVSNMLLAVCALFPSTPRPEPPALHTWLGMGHDVPVSLLPGARLLLRCTSWQVRQALADHGPATATPRLCACARQAMNDLLPATLCATRRSRTRLAHPPPLRCVPCRRPGAHARRDARRGLAAGVRRAPPPRRRAALHGAGGGGSTRHAGGPGGVGQRAARRARGAARAAQGRAAAGARCGCAGQVRGRLCVCAGAGLCCSGCVRQRLARSRRLCQLCAASSAHHPQASPLGL